jgi:nucleoside-diphosphate-sugar epimerase
VTGPGDPTWRWTHADVRDVAHAIVLAAEASRARLAIYNVGEATTPTMADRVTALVAAIGKPVSWGSPVARYPDLVVDSSRIRRELGFAEVTDADARIADLIAACRATRLRVA